MISSDMITVITPSIISRVDMLKENILSVNAQTLKPKDHLIYIDHNRYGCMHSFNRLLEEVKTPYFQWFSDDNIMYPNHIELLLNKIVEENADLVYSYPEVQGRDISFDVPFNMAELKKRNYISEPMYRTSAVRKAGGYMQESPITDWQLCMRMVMNGCKIVCVEQRTWIFRFGHGNTSTGDLI